MDILTNIQTYLYKPSHIHIVYTYIDALTCIHIYKNTLMQGTFTHIHVYIHSYRHTCTHVYIYTCTLMYKPYSYTGTLTCTHTYTNIVSISVLIQMGIFSRNTLTDTPS